MFPIEMNHIGKIDSVGTVQVFGFSVREGDPEAQHELIKLIVERVYVRDEQVVAMTLRSNYHLVLGHNANGPTEMSVDPFVYTHGSDGLGYLIGYSIRSLFGLRLGLSTTP